MTRLEYDPPRIMGGRLNKLVALNFISVFLFSLGYRSIVFFRIQRFHTPTANRGKDLTTTGLFIINGGRNSYDPVEILAKKLRKLNETNILVITILESQKLS